MQRTTSLVCLLALALPPLVGCADIIKGARTTSRSQQPSHSYLSYRLQETNPQMELQLEGSQLSLRLQHVCEREQRETYQDLHVQHYDNANSGLSWALGLSGAALIGGGAAGLLGAYDSLSEASWVDYGAIGALALGGVMLTGAIIDAARSTRTESSSEDIHRTHMLSPELCPAHISGGYGQAKVYLVSADARAIPLGRTDSSGRFRIDLAPMYARLKQASKDWGQPVFVVLEGSSGGTLDRLRLDESELFASFLSQYFPLALARCQQLEHPDDCEELTRLSQPENFAHQAHAQAHLELYGQARTLLRQKAGSIRQLKSHELWQSHQVEHHLKACLEAEHDSADALELACKPLVEALPLFQGSGSAYETRLQSAVSESLAYLQAYRAFEADSEALEAEDPFRPRRRYIRRKPYVYQPAQYRRGESQRSIRSYSGSRSRGGGGRGGGGRR